jgi:tetratricopeptide (TPR) repeat protein
MNCVRDSWRALLVAVALVALIPTVGGGMSEAVAQTGDVKVETVRPEIGRPVQAAQDFISARKFAEALVAIREAEGIGDRTPYENYVIDRLRAVAAAGAGDTSTAAKSFEAVMESGRLPPAEQTKVAEALATIYFRAGDYPKTITWATRYFKDGGADPQVRMLQARSLYLANDYASAATQLRAILDATEKTGAAPALNELQLLASCYAKFDDSAGYAFALEKLLAYYPKKEYWADAIRRVETRPGFAD